MKYLAILLSLFTMTMSALPCDDEISILNDRFTEIHSDFQDDDHSIGDLCSPFCTCVCCASIVVEEVFNQESIISDTFHNEINSFYTFSYSSDYLDRIFQPPKV
ncbi:MAG: hypothetical protein L3J34_01845 [Flavobacteriaceae bacterium]|nr:hypothetical protein [Flavobacteriaceae bacterium]